MFIKVSKIGHIAEIVVDRPNALNAMNPDVIQELTDELIEAIGDQDTGVVILTGTGEKAFVAGADIKAMQKLDIKRALEFGKLGHRLANTIESSPKPVIAAVNGFALGGGCEIALACHIRLASENAIFGQPEVKLGLIPGWGGTQRLPRIVGKGIAYELIITGRNIDAKHAYRIGLVNQVLPLNELMDAARSLAKLILKNGPKAITVALEQINLSSGPGLPEGLERELESFAYLFDSDETREGFTAFVEKRSPKFRR